MELVLAHLTDIHISGEKDLDILISRADNIGKMICSHITDPYNSQVIFCFTGDFAYSGKEDEFTIAGLFIEAILDVLKKRYCNIPYHLVFVPGNHDCDFEDPSYGLRKAILDSKSLDINDRLQMQQCTCIQKNYFAFVRQMKALSCDSDKIITAKEIYLDDINLSLVFHCINTSWCSDKQEKKGKMKFAFGDLPTSSNSQNDIVFTLMHHDAEWLDWEDKEQWEEYSRNYSDVIFVGHDHRSEYTIKKNYDDSTQYYIKGNQLYDAKNPLQSGFNILKINTNIMQECFVTYIWKDGLYKRNIYSGYRLFEKKQYSYGGVRLNKNTRLFLESLDVDIKGKSNKELKLSDIFYFPTLKENKQKAPKFLRDLDNTIDFFEERKWIVIHGHKEFGKTTLLKWLFKSYFDRKKYPVFLEVKDIPFSADGEELNSYVEDSYLKYYENLQREEIAIKDPEELVCFIDNLDLIKLDDKRAKKFLQYLTFKFGIIIVTRNIDLNLINPISYVEMNNYLKEQFTTLTIRPVSSSSKERLVNKWLMLDDENQGIDEVAFEEKRRDKYAQIQTVMQKNFFNKTPLDLLLVLSYLDQENVIPFNYSKYSYIYEALILTKLGQISNKDSNTISVYKTILLQIAYQMFNEGKDGWIEEEYLMKIIFQYKDAYSNLKLRAQDVITKLVEYRFFDNIDNEYRFKYSYMYYYFVGNYIVMKLSPETKESVIASIFENLRDNTNYNVSLFLLYFMNKEYEIIPIIRQQDAELLSEFNGFVYEDLSKLIIQWGGDIEAEVRRIYTVPENRNIPELRRRWFYNEDEIEEPEESEKKEPSDDELWKINKEVVQLVRLVDFSGNLLKNYSGELNNECREEIIGIMVHSVEKVIGAFCKFSFLAVNNIIKMVMDKIQTGDEKDIDAQNEFAKEIKRLFSEVWRHFIFLNIKCLGVSLECDILQPNIKKFVHDNKCEFTEMIQLEYLLKTSQRLPVNDINMLFKGKNKLSAISQDIMRNNIWGYLSNYQYDYSEKQKVCSTLGFDIRDVFIEEKKNYKMMKQ